MGDGSSVPGAWCLGMRGARGQRSALRETEAPRNGGTPDKLAIVKRTLLLAAAGGLLIALLKFLEYKYVIRAYSAEVYGGALAVIFTLAGIYAGVRLTRPKEVVVERPVYVPATGFVRDEAKVAALGLTPRELEILQLIAEGLSNREIGERLFVSEHTVKSHSSRLFDKLDVSRRTQAVQRAREYRLIE